MIFPIRQGITNFSRRIRMTISEVSRKYDLTQDTLRYYERAGMIPPVHRTTGGLRDYSEEDCSWVELVKCMRAQV